MRSNQTGSLDYQKLLYIWIVMVGVIAATAIIVGLQVYWWQKAEAKAEQKKLIARITKLQNEINKLKNNRQSSSGQSQRMSPQDQFYQALLAGKEQNVIAALQRKDMKALAAFVHPVKGLRFSPYISISPETDLVFPKERMAGFLHDKSKRIWGYYEGTGTQIKLSNEEYYKMYVYDRDYLLADKINYNTGIQGSLTAGNVFEVYPKGVIAEYQCVEKNSRGEELGYWRDLKLVFEAENNTWYLVGIIHDQWSI